MAPELQGSAPAFIFSVNLPGNKCWSIVFFGEYFLSLCRRLSRVALHSDQISWLPAGIFPESHRNS